MSNKIQEYAISATLGTLAAAYVTGDSLADFNLLLLLCAAGAAQQSQGYLLEVEQDKALTDEKKASKINFNENTLAKKNRTHTVVAYLTAVLLQSGEFAVVYDIIPNKGNQENWAYINYTLGYSKFVVLFETKRLFLTLYA